MGVGMVGWWVGEEVSEMCEEDKNKKVKLFIIQ